MDKFTTNVYTNGFADKDKELKERIGLQVSDKTVVIQYKNHRGEEAERTITPFATEFGSTPYHPEKQWLLQAYCHDRLEYRAFAMADISSWKSFDKRIKEIT